jgi:hypothetical protein
MNPINSFEQYSRENLLGGAESADRVYELVKAMSATAQTGAQLWGTTTAGAALKAESLDPTLKILTNREKHIVTYKMIPKQKAYNTVEEYNQMLDYGSLQGIGNLEGETPTFVDSQYRRQAAYIKYLGVAGEVTHPMTLVKLGSGVGNMLATETYNKMQYLMRGINLLLATGDSNLSAVDFDGVFKQHFSAVMGSSTNLDTYTADGSVIDARGKRLNDTKVEDAASSVVNDNYGSLSTILAAPAVFNNYVKEFHESKRIVPGLNGNAGIVGAEMGQSVNKIQTQFGPVDVVSDIFFDRQVAKLYNSPATSTKAPAAITPDISDPVTVAANTSTRFTDGAGDYFWGVVAANRYGESAMTMMKLTATAVATTEAVALKFAQSGGSYAAEYFIIYRGTKDAANYQTDKYYPIIKLSVAELATGWDGGGTGVVKDLNRYLPGTHSAIVFDNSEEVWAWKQLAPLMKMDLAIVSPSYRFMILCYATLVLFAPKKISRIINLGATVNA